MYILWVLSNYCTNHCALRMSAVMVYSYYVQNVRNKLTNQISYVVYRKWDRPRYSDTLVSRDVWMNSNEEKGDGLKVGKIDKIWQP